MTNKEKVFSALRGEGLSLALACGIMANIQRESSYNPTAKGDSGTSYGLCQWHKSRWERLEDYCFDNAIPVGAIESQIRFLLWEFKKYYTKHWNAIMMEPNTPEGAYNVAYTMCVKYEIPASKETKGKQRGEIAKELFAEFSASQPSVPDTKQRIINGLRETIAELEGVIEWLST